MHTQNTMIIGLLLATTAVYAAERTWDGGGTDANWSTTANWDGDASAPAAGDALRFGGATRLVNTNDLAAGTAFGGITFLSGAGAFSLLGNGLTLDGDVVNSDGDTQTLALPMVLSGTRKLFSTTGAITVSGALSGAGGLIADATNRTVTLAGDNSYEGVTVATNGSLLVTHSNALGSPDAPTVVYGRMNGSLRLSGGITINEPLTLSGQRPNYGYTLRGDSGSNTINGLISKVNEIRLACNNSASTLVIAGGIQAVSGGGDVIMNAGGGTLIIGTTPINLGTANIWSDQGGNVVLAVANNIFNETRSCSGTVRTDVPGALPVTSKIAIGAGYSPSGTVNLNGNDQTVAQLSADTTVAGTRTVTSPVPAVLTLNQNANSTFNGMVGGALSIIKNGTGSILFTNGMSTTTGDLIVNTGIVVIAQSASFSAVGNVVVNGLLDMRTGSGLADAATLRIADGGAQVKLGGATMETVDRLFLNGVQQASGTWGASGSGAAHVDDVHFSGSGMLNVFSSPPVTPVDAIWDGEGGAGDTRISVAANWAGDAVPVMDGTPRAVFGTGGITASVDTAMSLYGIVFNRDGAFTLAAGAGALTNGAGGIDAQVPVATSSTYTIDADMVFKENQTWGVTNAGSGVTTLVVSGSLDDGLSIYSLIKSGNGVLSLTGANTYDGVTTVKTGGVLRISNSLALGSADGNTVIENGGWLEVRGGITVDEPITLNGDQAVSHAGVLRSYSGSNVWRGPVTCNASRIRCYGGSLDVVGGVSGSQLVVGSDGGTWVRFAETPITAGSLISHSAGGATVLAVTNNRFTYVEVGASSLRTDLPHVFSPVCTVQQGAGSSRSSVLNLNGNDQTVGAFKTGWDGPEARILYSVPPATLTVTQNTDTVYNGSITGAVSLVKLGTGTLTLSGTNTTSGCFAVSNGTLAVASPGTFGPNSTNLTVGGTGTLSITSTHPSAVAESATLTMPAAGQSGAMISVAAGNEVRVGWLVYGEKVQRAGTYGGTGSGANYIDPARFAGTGVLRVLHDTSGTLIFLR